MTTPRDILVGAFGFSSKNKPEQIESRKEELFEVVMRAMRGLYTLAAEINPEFFGKQAAVGFAAGGWTQPADAESVYYIENPAGKEVVVVPRSDLKADLARPAVWKLANMYFGAGNALDPTAGNLQFFYSRRATKPASVDTAFTAEWPTDHDGLLITETAMHLALNDGRKDEAAIIQPDRDRAAYRFVARLEHDNVNTVYSYGASRNYNVPNLIKSILAQVQT
jgi:hypothetical protein